MPRTANSPGATEPSRGARPYIGVRFGCCNVYRRIYLNRDGTAFEGHCPRCAAKCRIRAGRSGQRARFWSAG